MIVANAVKGVKEGYEKKLELVGVGYRARLEGTTLVMTLGWNHPIRVEPYEGIEIEVPDETKITIRGVDKQKVGEFAAKVRSQREPEPYKGKGVRYADEYVRRKSSKTSLVAE
jgi:large subunit ribosomal protein L6